jgi:predicted Zn-dependent protease
VLILLVCTVRVTAATTDLARLKFEAQASEQAGDKAGAVAAYQRILAADPTAERVLAERLIQLHIELRRPQEALALAQRVKDQKPDPSAYLADVLLRCGSHREAQALLEKEIQAEARPARQVQLLLQLADLHGDQPEAESALRRALAAATGTAWEARVRDRMARRSTARPPTPAKGP